MSSAVNKSRRLIEDKQTYSRLLSAALLVLIFSVFIRTAWISDDAFITLRTIDNFIHGHGLTWNVGERVQAYSHPLWLMALTPVYYFTREPYFGTLFLSLVLSFGAVLFMALKIRITWFQTLAGILLLCCSKAFTDYATSGLENPLAYFLAALFLFEYRKPHITFSLLLIQSFLVALLLLTRQDLGLIFLPALGYSTWRYGKWVGAFALGAGLFPWFAWLLFSLFYYGFPLPNTAYAKLQTGIPVSELWSQGLLYFWNSLSTDPLTLLAILGISGFMVYLRRKRWLVLSASLLLYMLYVLSIGGDFMSGRFFALPLFCLVVAFNSVQVSHSFIFRSISITVLVSAGLFSPYSPVFSGKSYRKKEPLNALIDKAGICDERGFYYTFTGFLNQDFNRRGLKHPDAERGRLAKAVKQRVNINGAVGFLGYYAGPEVYVVDYYALGDPLLARLPVVEKDSLYQDWYKKVHGQESPFTWRPGHFRRTLPAGYLATRASGQNRIQDPDLHQGWNRLQTVISAPLFSKERVKQLKILWLDQKGQVFPPQERNAWTPIAYTEILAYDSTDVSTGFIRAQELFFTGEVDSAAFLLRNIAGLSPYFVSVNRTEFGSAWFAITQRYTENKRYNKALDAAAEAENYGVKIPSETLMQIREKAEMESLFFPERTKR